MRADEAFLRQLLGGIVLQPEHMRFDRTEDERGILFRIHLAKADMPLVIGKAGQSIKALRLVMKMHAKDGPAISLKLGAAPAQDGSRAPRTRRRSYWRKSTRLSNSSYSRTCSRSSSRSSLSPRASRMSTA